MTAVDIDCGAADEPGACGRQKHDKLRDFFGSAGPSGGKLGVQFRPAVLVAEEPFGARHDVRQVAARHGGPWIDGDDAHAVAHAFAAEALGEHIERDIRGAAGSTWKSLNSGPTENWVRNNKVTVLVQLGVKKAVDIPATVPLGLDLAKTPADREVLEVLCAPSATGFPSFMGPGVPVDRIAAVRAAYEQSLKDPEFLAAIRQQNLDLDPIGADELTGTVRHIYELPNDAVEGARKLLSGEGSGD
jgi:hypothetical protein